MSYFIFFKNADNKVGTLYRIAENESDYNNLNISDDMYKIIEDNQENFNNIKFGSKGVEKYNNNTITYINTGVFFQNKEKLSSYVNDFKDKIKNFVESNPNHPLFNRWNSYYNQLNSLNLDNVQYPLNKSLEQYFNDLGQSSLNPLQIP